MAPFAVNSSQSSFINPTGLLSACQVSRLLRDFILFFLPFFSSVSEANASLDKALIPRPYSPACCTNSGAEKKENKKHLLHCEENVEIRRRDNKGAFEGGFFFGRPPFGELDYGAR